MPHLRPAEGLKVINPATGAPLPPEGADVPLSTYWRRRLRDGSVSEAEPDRQAPKAEKTSAPAKDQPRSRRSRGRSNQD